MVETPASATDRPLGIRDIFRQRWSRLVLELVGNLLLFWLIGRLSEVLTPLLIGLVAAYTLDPVVTWLTRHGFTRRLAVTLVFGSFLAALLVALVWGVPKAWRESRLLYQEAMVGDSFKDLNGDGRWEPDEPITRDLLGGDHVYHEAWLKRRMPAARWSSMA